MRKETGQQYFEAENAHWGMDHAFIGAAVLHCWKLPILLTEPINWHHAPELAPSYKMAARLLAAANFIAHSGPDVESGLCKEAISLLPEGADSAALRDAVAQPFADANTESLMNIVE